MITVSGRAEGGTLGGVHLPVMPPVAPMLAKGVKDVTTVPAPSSVAGGLLYEPKWDVSKETLTP